MTDSLHKIFLFVATKREADAIISNNEPVDVFISNGIKLRKFIFNNNEIYIIITGVGKTKTIKTLDAVAHLINDALIINIGIAGCIDIHIKQCRWFVINKIMADIPGSDIIELKTQTGHQSTSLLTVLKPIDDSNIKKQLLNKYEAKLVDMEGFYIAEFASSKMLPCVIIKMVSDNANEFTGSDYISALGKYDNEVWYKITSLFPK